MELIPGLPDDVARDCLLRVMYNQLPTVVSVCKGWKHEVELPEFRSYRQHTCHSQKLIVIAQAGVGSDKGSDVLKYRASPVYRFSILEPETGVWCDLPPIPEFPDGLPMFSRVVSAGSGLVVLGGLDPGTWEACNSVFVFDFASAEWRRGTDMPGLRRSFFGCASDFDRTVYVVGGHDDEKNALRSAMAYDVVKDEWVPLPDMARERDECKAVFHHGKIYVIGGYCTDMQGRFERSAEVFEVATWQWGQLQEDYLAASKCPRTCICGDDGSFYMWCDGDVIANKGSTWQTLAKIPADVRNVAYLTTWQSKLLVIGSAKYGGPHMTYVLDLENYTWTKVDAPGQYSGHVQSGCFLEI